MDHLQPVSRFINPYSQKQRHKFKPCIAVIVKKHERPADALVRVLRVKFHPCKENSQRLVLYVTDGELVIQCKLSTLKSSGSILSSDWWSPGLVNGQKHPLFTSGDITKNDYIRLIEFDISSRKQVGTGNRIW